MPASTGRVISIYCPDCGHAAVPIKIVIDAAASKLTVKTYCPQCLAVWVNYVDLLEIMHNVEAQIRVERGCEQEFQWEPEDT